MLNSLSALEIVKRCLARARAWAAEMEAAYVDAPAVAPREFHPPEYYRERFRIFYFDACELEECLRILGDFEETEPAEGLK